MERNRYVMKTVGAGVGLKKKQAQLDGVYEVVIMSAAERFSDLVSNWLSNHMKPDGQPYSAKYAAEKVVCYTGVAKSNI
jgi:hypothetical protein